MGKSSTISTYNEDYTLMTINNLLPKAKPDIPQSEIINCFTELHLPSVSSDRATLVTDR